MSHRTGYDRERKHHYIKQWRKLRGYRQSQLAEMIGTSVPNLSRIETFQQPYTQDFVEAAADALGVEVVDLISVDPSAPKIPSEVAILDSYRTASPEIKNAIHRILATGTTG